MLGGMPMRRFYYYVGIRNFNGIDSFVVKTLKKSNEHLTVRKY